MKPTLLLVLFLATCVHAPAQVEFIPDNFFPAEHEFAELENMASEKLFSDPVKLSSIEDGQLISDVGFKEYAQRKYAAGSSEDFSIEIVTLFDYRAAFSLLSLLRSSAILEDAYGDAYAASPGEIIFCHGRRWIRIKGAGFPQDLLSRVALSISNRMGEAEGRRPSLISHFPESGLRSESLEYFPSIKSFETFHPPATGDSLSERFEMEIARARYDTRSSSGGLFLLKFPTTEMAEDYFLYLSTREHASAGTRLFFKMSGPLLSVLEGSFRPKDALNILDSIQYGYSVQWIRDNQSQYTVVWGIPVQILTTTVYSFFLVLLLCGFSILAGGIFAGLRLLLRRYFPNNPLDDPERTEITRLKLS